MKRVYWRPNRISKGVILCVGLAAVVGALGIELFPVGRNITHQSEKLAAASLAQRGMLEIRKARLARGHRFEQRFDPAESGMIGAAMSPVTSLPSHLEAKQTSVNPNFAAAIVGLLVEAKVESGDVVAVGYTGSFPAFNTCVCAALESLGVKPLVIHSAASSQFGANHPEMMWLDMETVLREAGIISFRTHAATLGGFGDRARGMSVESIRLLSDSITRNDVLFMKVRTLQDSIEQRMQLYAKLADSRPIAAYINVGGGAASIHGAQGREAFGAGLASDLSKSQADIDCVASRFATIGVPVIHIGNAIELAKKFRLPIAPQEMPHVGAGAVFATVGPSRPLAGLLLALIAVCLRTYLWTDLWARLASRIFEFKNQRSVLPGELRLAAAPQAEPMV